MMRPDIKIVIAWSGDYQKKAAQMMYDKLTAYIKMGYPVSVSFINEERINEDILFYANREGDLSDGVRIAKNMETYFSNFDYAFFFFDTHTKIHNEDGSFEEIKTPILSANLLYEYGLASSSFINRSIEKKIFCFSPSEIDKKTLQYINGIDLKLYKNFLIDNKDDMEEQTNFIINDFIHEKILKTNNLFYGLPYKLPNLVKQEKGYVIDGNLSMKDPMNLENNTYWADLRKLQPSGIVLSLNKQSEPLNDIFIKEYNQFNDAKDNRSEYILGRRLLYIVDRAVFIMYLRQEDYWNDRVIELYSIAKELKSKNVNVEYYIKCIQSLQGVFMYQQCSRPKSDDKPLSGMLFNKLDDIENLLKPISEIGWKEGNRMIYCMATDYLALVYHKKATKELGEFIGKRDFYLDDKEHFNLLRKKLKEGKDIKSINQVIDTFYKAALLFKNVVDCQTELQSYECNSACPRYIWKSYALYNQARCEFAIYLIFKLYKTKKNVFEEEKKLSEYWCNNLYEAVISRKQDYVDFDPEKQPLFPQVIVFNMQAEYYHAFYEYELSCLIAKQLKPGFEAQDFPNDDKFQEWKGRNLTVSDVLNVDGKVERLKKLRANYIQDLITDKKVAEGIVNIVNKDKINKEDKDKLVEIINSLQDKEKNSVTKFLFKNGGDIVKGIIANILYNAL